MNPPGKLVVITGGSGMLARATAAALARPGWCVATPTRAELDVSRRDAIETYFLGKSVDLLVCAAGLTRDAPLFKSTAADWDAVWQVNFHGALDCARAVLPAMVERGSGHLIFISSRSALHPPIGQANYATAKAALLGLTASLAAEYGPHNIRVNAILPGFLETPMTQHVTAARKSQVLADHALARFNTCHAAAEMIAFLHHSLLHTSGQIFQLDSRPSASPYK